MNGVFCDTSVLVAASVRDHPHHGRGQPVVESVLSGAIAGSVSRHSLAEIYSALTTIPVEPRISPVEARQLIDENVLKSFRIIEVTEEMYRRALEVCMERGIPDGPVYDALIIECARSVDPERIYTFNLRNFRNLAPDLRERLVSP